MTRKISSIFGMVCCTLFAITLHAQQHQHHRWENVERTGVVNIDSTTKGGYALIFMNKDSTFSKQTEQRMTEVFFEVYPKEAKEYNPATNKKVFMIIDPEYKGVAATGGSVVRVNPEWMHKHPEDLDVVTHEVMHIVQSYHGNVGHGWITEGIADYARNEFGVNNAAAGWSLTPFNASQSYTNAYRITARFFVWIVKKYDKDFVRELNVAMRDNTYTDAFWEDKTGKSVDELWAEYAADPAI